MPAKYQLFKNPRSILEEGREEKLYPKIVRNRTVNLDEMSKNISASSTFTHSDVVGVWAALKREIIEELRSGNRVELGGIGDFYVILKCRDITDPKEIRAESIRFSKVAFSPSKEFHRQFQGMPVERDETPPPPTIESQPLRMERILGYLEIHGDITSSVCMRINNCSRETAQKDLRALHQAGRVNRHGPPSVSIYTLKRDTL